jgi:hypothetical protein
MCAVMHPSQTGQLNMVSAEEYKQKNADLLRQKAEAS